LDGENRPLVTDEPIDFEKEPVEGQDFRKISNQSRRICGNIPQNNEENPNDNIIQILNNIL
jgi:hypothetical protein